MRIIITGAGQDSSYLAELLLDEGHEVFCLTRRSCTSNHWRLAKAKASPNFHLLECDITDSNSVNRFILSIKPDEIYNLAAQSHVGTSFTNPTATWNSVALGALNIFEAVKDFSPKTKVYQASSSEMFGNMLTLTDYDSGEWSAEYCGQTKKALEKLRCCQCIDTPFNPQSPYGVAKLAAHNSARVYRKSYGLDICCGILFNHESSRRGINFVTRKITNYFWRVFDRQENLPKLKLGNLDICRDWGYAKEYCEKMISMVREPVFGYDCILATETAISIADFCQMALDVASKGKEKDIYQFVESVPELVRPNEVPYLRGCGHYVGTVTVDKLIEEMILNENGLT